LVGAAFPLFGGDMFDKLGYGWGCTVLGGASILLMPMPYLIMKFGKRVRERFPVKLD
jgi:MFS transporter, DHA1 family, multidrug resistance protein